MNNRFAIVKNLHYSFYVLLFLGFAGMIIFPHIFTLLISVAWVVGAYGVNACVQFYLEKKTGEKSDMPMPRIKPMWGFVCVGVIIVTFIAIGVSLWA